MKKILILSNHHEYTYNFRKEIIGALIEKGYKVYIILPYGDKVELLKEMGCTYINLPLDRRGMNPLKDLILIKNYMKTIKKIKPDVILSYTLKPNIYGAMVSRILKIPFIANITGLGSAVEKKGILQKALINLYRVTFKNVNCIFFQNKEDQNFFEKYNIGKGKYKLIPGSGVNVEKFNILEYPSQHPINFSFISRIMKEKGIEQYLEAAKYIKKKYPNVQFHVLGFCEEDYEKKLTEMHHANIIKYHGMQSDIISFLKFFHCTVHPTYYPEGMSNVLLESAASARPIITTNRSGCKEIVDDEVNGFIVKEKNVQDLIDKLEKFIQLDHNSKKQMGLNGRIKIEKEFDRQYVVDSYLNEIEKIIR